MCKNTKSILTPLAFLLLFFILLKIFFPNQKLFDYNLMEVLTTVIVTFGIYFFTKVDNYTDRKNKKVEETIEWIKDKLYDVFSGKIEQSRHAEYLHSFKHIDNKIEVLEKLSKHLDCEKNIEKIKSEKQRLDEFINDNIGQGDSYFLGDTVKEKVPNILCNIESQLDEIMLKIYSDDLIILHIKQ